jgi:hypothetical protein
MEPDPDLITRAATAHAPWHLHARSMLVLSVTVTETTFASVRTVTHVLVVETGAHKRDESTGRIR